MKLAKWSCMSCEFSFDAPWQGGAFLMAKKCIRCGKVAVSIENSVFEEGCLTIQPEEETPINPIS